MRGVGTISHIPEENQRHFKGLKGSRAPLTVKMELAAKLAATGLSNGAISKQLGVSLATVGRWFERSDMRELRSAALNDVVAAMVPRAYAVLQAQLDSSNPWVAQGAARELIRLYNVAQGAADQSVVVTFGAMPQPGAPAGAAALPDGDTVESGFADDDDE